MSRQYELQYFSSADGKHRSAMYIWRPELPVRGIVQIIHGMQEHMGRYSDFAAFLNQQGYVVCGNDHLGHGLTVGEDGAYGYFGEADGSRILLKDCHRATGIIRRQYPYRPVFLLGHSMGSILGRLYILHFAQELAGFICMGTSGEQQGAAYGRALAEILTLVRGADAEGKLLDKLVFSSYNKRFASENIPVAWLSRDQELGAAYLEDKHCHQTFRNRGFADLFTMLMAVSKKQWAEKVKKDLPILLVSGMEDPVGQYGKGVVQVYERLKMAGLLDVKCKLYPQARHELLGELNKEEVYYDILQWIASRG